MRRSQQDIHELFRRKITVDGGKSPGIMVGLRRGLPARSFTTWVKQLVWAPVWLNVNHMSDTEA